MSKSLPESAAAAIRTAIDKATAEENRIPGFVTVVVGKDGKQIFSHASGTRGIGTKEPMTLDTIFYLASCTKLISIIAVLQLVEKGALALDDADQLEELCPELKKIRILEKVDESGKGYFVDKKNRITLRMLLTHTAGLGYCRIQNNRDWLSDFGSAVTLSSTKLFANGAYRGAWMSFKGRLAVSWSSHSSSNLAHNGNIAIEWVGIIVERVSKFSLGEYFQKNIFKPLDIKNTSFLPTEQMKAKLAVMHTRDPDGTVRARDHVWNSPFVTQGDDLANLFHSGGGGLFGQIPEYSQILAALLNDGALPTDPSTRILSPTTIIEAFTNQIPHWPDFGRQSIPAPRPHFTNPIPELWPQPHDQPQGWGLLGVLAPLNEGEGAGTGRGKLTTHWAGVANLFWWCDREKGIAGIVAAQILPFGDAQVINLWHEIETLIYASLEDSNLET
ncbi:hypothetical protein MMC22_003999 [Lobaria immixta]|nr:hypothetical protein [Lobaria immixta]